MKNVLVFTAIVAALLLTGCSKSTEEANEEKRKYTEKRNAVDYVADLGIIDGCHTKYVSMTSLPNFYIVRCPKNTTSSFYETGGKSKTRIGAVVEEEEYSPRQP